ncbi:MAG TPA: hypothetical protein VHW95_07550 [Steroidobacteraceae bacterium]|jgi:hypothetical protein|nr:hypothetical protein [Steroidobacteraceae bacterium]
MHSPHRRFQIRLAGLVSFLMLVTLWLWLRGYHGITGDGQLYALQAVARIHPQLASDLYLQNTSQDQFTIFSPMYAWVVEHLGLEHAARLLTLLFTIFFLTASFIAARAIGGRNLAWLTVAGLLIIGGNYGGSGVFGFAAEYLTARLAAEALIVTSLVCHLHGRKSAAIAIATLALLIHPLIALPGLLLLLCLTLPNRLAAVGAFLSILATMAIAFAAANLAWASRVLPPMDPAWLDVVRERSQFLFLQLWSFRDWNLNARPFFSLMFTMLAIEDERIRKICVSGILVGGTGLAIAAVAGTVGPIALLIQGQAWRWVWVTVFLSVLVLPATILQVWRDDRYGSVCAILLALSWLLAANSGMVCISLAIILWVMRTTIGERAAPLVRWVSFALIIAFVACQVAQVWGFKSSIGASVGSPFAMERLKGTFALRIFAAVAVAIGWRLLRIDKLWLQTLLATALVALLIFVLPSAFKQSHALGAAADIAEFSDWERIIPKTSTVLVTPARDVGAFVWFTLQRPNYLAVDQSAGVVFSRATALEVERRSQVLLPVMYPNWKILTKLQAPSSSIKKGAAESRPLTARSLGELCADTRLNFIISPENVGFDPPQHENAGPWKDWNLYDCRNVRQPRSTQPLP